MNINRTIAGITSLIIIFAFCSGCQTGQKETDFPSSEGDHSICNTYTKWVKNIAAYDSQKNMYYAYICKDRIVFLSPYSTLLYSREGNVIGFQRDGVFHFHAPSKGWKELDTSSVGHIGNMYEGKDDCPDLSEYKAPPTSVK